MRSLKKVFEAIEAFREDMEKLGVRMHVSVAETPVGSEAEVAINLKTLVREDIEDLEAEGVE